jgi:predicted DNA binding protein
MATGTTDTADEGTAQVLRAQLVVEPHSESSCAVLESGTDATEITHQVKPGGCTDDAAGCGECHTELTVETDGEQRRTYLQSPVESTCICPVFEHHDCIQRIVDVREGQLVVALTVPERAALQDIISDLRSVGATVSVDWLVDGRDTDATAEIDVGSITENQQEAMRTAEELGYYETPRRADLGAVADALGISESAASQRLNAAERKLVDAFLDT